MAASAFLAACATQPAPGQAAPQPGQPISGPLAEKTFVSRRYGFRITSPAALVSHRTFRRSYLENDDWKAYAGPKTPPGKAVLDLILPDSNHITDGEVRIGVSRRPSALKTCTHAPDAIRPGSLGHITLSGVTFTTFSADDAAMSHYLRTHSYRAVHHGTCYAIDVLVYGTRPDVYSPPATPPFSPTQAFSRLTPVVKQLQFLPQANADRKK